MDHNMSKDIKEELQTVSTARKAIIPIFSDLIDKVVAAINEQKTPPAKPLNIEKLENEVSRISSSIDHLSKYLVSLEKTLNKSETPVTLPAPVVNIPEEVTVKNVVKTEIIQNNPYEISGVVRVDGLLESLKKLQKSLMNNNPQKLPSVIPVKITNWQHSEGGGGGSRNTDNMIWLREQYSYSTINGEQKVTKVEKWNDQYKMTETFEYNNDYNVSIKNRLLEPVAQIGQ